MLAKAHCWDRQEAATNETTSEVVDEEVNV
jgi:hypothetical protein